jgi:antitoxin VapB
LKSEGKVCSKAAEESPVNDIAKVTRRRGRPLVALPEGLDVEGDELRVRREGRNLVLEPVEGGADGADWIDRIMGTLDEDFARAALAARA